MHLERASAVHAALALRAEKTFLWLILLVPPAGRALHEEHGEKDEQACLYALRGNVQCVIAC